MKVIVLKVVPFPIESSLVTRENHKRDKLQRTIITPYFVCVDDVIIE